MAVAVQAAALKASGLVVYIRRDVEYLTKRIAGDSNRPDLDASKSFAEIMQRREPYYLKAAVSAPHPPGAVRQRHARSFQMAYITFLTSSHVHKRGGCRCTCT